MNRDRKGGTGDRQGQRRFALRHRLKLPVKGCQDQKISDRPFRVAYHVEGRTEIGGRTDAQGHARQVRDLPRLQVNGIR